ncbi:MAG TPA: RNA polymerase sigma factor [Ktedonobacteraceae bacterium]|jgi:RNA polymerase sigma-70 factor (ECF subfamily)
MFNQICQPDHPRNSAMGQLYQQHAPAIYTYVRLRVSSQEDAEDILLDIFAAALENPKFALWPEGEQLAWLRTVTRNKVVDCYRRVNRYQPVELAQVADQLFDDDFQAPEHVAVRNEEHAHLHTAMQRLSNLQQQVVRLRFFGDLRCAEIAAVLGKREGTVRVLLSRSLNLLRKIYEEQ